MPFQQTALGLLEQLLSTVLAQSTDHAMLLTRQLFVIRLFVPLFQHNLPALQATLEKVHI